MKREGRKEEMKCVKFPCSKIVDGNGEGEPRNGMCVRDLEWKGHVTASFNEFYRICP